MDFSDLAQRLLGQAEALLSLWLPGGHREGHEYLAARRQNGGPGDGLSVNLTTGRWAHFAGGAKGGDLIDLYAHLHGVDLGAAFRALEPAHFDAPKIAKKPEYQSVYPPEDGVLPLCDYPGYGEPTKIWQYRDETGRLMYLRARYESAEGKSVRPWSWDGKRWVAKGWTARKQPLYGLQKLAEAPGRAVLLVEGEKAADAAQALCGPAYCVLTWPNGAEGVERADFAPLAGRHVMLWPDGDRKEYKPPHPRAGEIMDAQDQPGLKAMVKAAEMLLAVGAASVKIIEVGVPEADLGWDAADAVAEGWTWDRVLAWARPRVRLVEAPTVTSTVEILPPKTREVPPDEQPMPMSVYARYEFLGLAMTGKGTPFTTLDNVQRFLDADPDVRGKIWLDDFHGKLFTQWNFATWTDCERRRWADADDLRLTTYIQRHLGLVKMSLDTVRQGIIAFGAENTRNEPRDWLNALTWDGQARIEAFFPAAFGCAADDYTTAVSANFFKSLAARILWPGCKVDSMIVLQGPQGCGKTSALELLGGPWYVASGKSVETSDFQLQLRGKVLMEIAEMDSFRKSEVDAVKTMLTIRNDDYRVPYGHAFENVPRTCVFAGTTNRDEFLNDPTGARRFWPIRCKKINLDLIRTLRDQLYAEARVRVVAGEKWHEMPVAETLAAQEEHRVTDEWEAPIKEYIDGLPKITLVQIYADALGGSILNLDTATTGRLRRILRALGWTRKGGNYVPGQ